MGFLSKRCRVSSILPNDSSMLQCAFFPESATLNVAGGLTAECEKENLVMLKLTPPMGWNSWNTFASNINEQLIFEMADTMVSEIGRAHV